MKKLICNKCGAEVAPLQSTATNSETGQTIPIKIKRLPFGLCQECFEKEFLKDPATWGEKIRVEAHAIVMESLAQALAQQAGAGDEVFDYQCPGCGAKAKGIGNKEQYENAMKVKPLCPECQNERSHRETAGEEQSFSM